MILSEVLLIIIQTVVFKPWIKYSTIHFMAIMKTLTTLLLLVCFASYGMQEQAFKHIKDDSVQPIKVPEWLHVEKDIRVANYFQYMDSLIVAYDSLVPYKLSEHIIVRANPWIIDTLANTDYYRTMAKDSFVYDQTKMVILRMNDSLFLPKKKEADSLSSIFASTLLDVNIPEFKFRIMQDSVVIYTFPIRVGQNRRRYLELAEGELDLRTKRGQGTIVRHARDPDFYNPVNGKQFHLTRRDDQKTTLMPQIPWIETEINGLRNGQLIHPTTNPKSLGKAYSNGCIGTREADAWYIYYHAPLGTAIRIRYDLQINNDDGEPIILKDIYGVNK